MLRRLTRQSILVFIPLILISCVGLKADHWPSFDEFKIGMEKPELLRLFGEPNIKPSTQVADHNWEGPGSTFFKTLPKDTQFEEWGYTGQHEWAVGDGNRMGTIFVYFIDGSTAVSGLSFFPDGVVY